MAGGGRGNGGGGGGGRGPLPRSVQVSKKVSWLLRHGAEEEGLQLDKGGFLNVQDVLSNRKFRSMKVTFDEIREAVENNDKQRFTMVPVLSAPATASVEADAIEAGQEPSATSESNDPSDWLIRANQGHSIKVEDDQLLKPITAENMPDVAVHGTTHAAYVAIMSSGGLKSMGRKHIHFATGLPAGFKSIADQSEDESSSSDKEKGKQPPVISGMRNSSTVLMFLDVPRAMVAGIKFWISDNGVILSEGDKEGIIALTLFKRVEDRTGEGLFIEDGHLVKEIPESWREEAVKKGKVKG